MSEGEIKQNLKQKLLSFGLDIMQNSCMVTLSSAQANTQKPWLPQCIPQFATRKIPEIMLLSSKAKDANLMGPNRKCWVWVRLGGKQLDFLRLRSALLFLPMGSVQGQLNASLLLAITTSLHSVCCGLEQVCLPRHSRASHSAAHTQSRRGRQMAAARQ